MPIKTTRDRSNELTEHVVSGLIIDDEMFACQKEFYEGGPTRLQLWDMTAADLAKITTDGLRRFVGRAAMLGEVRRGGRTAVIVRSGEQYGLARMAEVFGEFESLPFAYAVFRSRDEALAWLLAESKSQPAGAKDGA
jgi:hypothetical protein